MATLKQLVDETTNIKNELISCHSDLKTNLIDKGVEVLEGDGISDLICKIEEMKVPTSGFVETFLDDTGKSIDASSNVYFKKIDNYLYYTKDKKIQKLDLITKTVTTIADVTLVHSSSNYRTITDFQFVDENTVNIVLYKFLNNSNQGYSMFKYDLLTQTKIGDDIALENGSSSMLPDVFFEDTNTCICTVSLQFKRFDFTTMTSTNVTNFGGFSKALNTSNFVSIGDCIYITQGCYLYKIENNSNTKITFPSWSFSSSNANFYSFGGTTLLKDEFGNIYIFKTGVYSTSSGIYTDLQYNFIIKFDTQNNEFGLISTLQNTRFKAIIQNYNNIEMLYDSYIQNVYL